MITVTDTHQKAIHTKYLSPSNVRGSRYTAWDSDGNRVMVSADHALNSEDNHRAAAKALCAKMQWEGLLLQGWNKHGSCCVFLPRNATLNILGGVK